MEPITEGRRGFSYESNSLDDDGNFTFRREDGYKSPAIPLKKIVRSPIAARAYATNLILKRRRTLCPSQRRPRI